MLRVDADDAEQCGDDWGEDDAAVLEGVAHGQQTGADVPAKKVEHGIRIPVYD